MKVEELINAIRYKQKDHNEVRFSDYDIIQSMNEALRYINQSNALKNSDFLENMAFYHLKEMNEEIDEWNAENPEEDQKEHVDFRKGVDLPDDFLSIVSIRDRFGHPLHPCPSGVRPRHHQYKIVGNKLYLHGDADLLYRYILPPVTMDGDIDLPRIFFDPIVKITGMILNQSPDSDVMMQEVNTIVDSLIPARRYFSIDPKLPFVLRS